MIFPPLGFRTSTLTLLRSGAPRATAGNNLRFSNSHSLSIPWHVSTGTEYVDCFRYREKVSLPKAGPAAAVS
eukprot:scaffold131_cov55-Attheya_sp.AAC.8